VDGASASWSRARLGCNASPARTEAVPGSRTFLRRLFRRDAKTNAP